VIIVDTSVWIDYFNGRRTPETEGLDALLGREPVGIGDLILMEVLRGFRTDADFRRARHALLTLDVFDMLGARRALRCAEHFRALRKRGVTVRRSTDVVIASYCIDEGYPLLFSDRDLEPFVRHLGLQSAA
jgi:hypothetical protein